MPRELPRPRLIFFPKPTPYILGGSLEHHPPPKLPNLESTTTLHQASLSCAKRRSHFPNTVCHIRREIKEGHEGHIWVCNFFVLYSTILYHIQNCEYRENLFFEIMFGWFRKPETKLKRVE